MLIGISGQMGAGKDTIGRLLATNQHGRVLHFSDKLKEIAKDLFGVDRKNPQTRRILQELGTKMREIDPDVWVNYLMKNVRENDVICDVRYVNEACAILDKGGRIIYLDVMDVIRYIRVIQRDGAVTLKEWNEMNQHSSEKLVSDIKSLPVKSVIIIEVSNINASPEYIYEQIMDSL